MLQDIFFFILAGHNYLLPEYCIPKVCVQDVLNILVEILQHLYPLIQI